MRTHTVICSVVIALLTASPAVGAVYEVDVSSDLDVYEVGDTAHFDVAVYKNGHLVHDQKTIIEATFPDGDTPVELTEAYPGSFTYETELAESGEATLTVSVRRDRSPVVNAMERIVDRLEARVVPLVERLEGETRPQKIRMLERRIAALQTLIDFFEGMIDALEAPLASDSVTILVEGSQPGDTTPPEFGIFWPTPPNGYSWIREAYEPAGIAVTDAESGVAVVVGYVDGATEPVEMVYAELDDDRAGYFHFPTTPWSEGVHTIEVVAVDNAGNVATATVDNIEEEEGDGIVFGVDLTPPEIVGIYPTSTNEERPSITIEAQDALSGVYVHADVRLVGSASVDTITMTSSDPSFGVWTPGQDLMLGYNGVEVTIYDDAGNWKTQVFGVYRMP